MADARSKALEEAQLARDRVDAHINKDILDGDQVVQAWHHAPEFPAREEICPLVANRDGDAEYRRDPNYNRSLPINIVNGPWESDEQYLSAHYHILREDAVAPLRMSVAKYRTNPGMLDDQDTRVYTNVHITGLLCSSQGLATRIEFSTNSATAISWENSDRLMQGTMLAMTPSSDNFQTDCRIITVAARPIQGGLDQNPPMVDIFWCTPSDLSIDPLQTWLIIEASSGYFEASRHMLKGIQRGMDQKLPLSRQLVKVVRKTKPPKFRSDNPKMDLETMASAGKDPADIERQAVDPYIYNVDVLNDFPESLDNSMDRSQMEACKAVLTQQVAIIQGPPGTGKTFVSVSALRVLLNNWRTTDPPIIVTAQTNHALDQLLNHILEFEPDIVRLGGRTGKEHQKIQERTLFRLRQANGTTPGIRLRSSFFTESKKLINKMRDILQPLITGGILSSEFLKEKGILKKHKFTVSTMQEAIWSDDDSSSEEEGSKTNTNDRTSTSQGNQREGDLEEWLGGNIVQMLRAPLTNIGLPAGEIDLEYEQSKHRKDTMTGFQDDEIDSLKGTWIQFARGLTADYPHGLSLARAKKVVDNYNNKDLKDVPQDKRAQFYRACEVQLIAGIQHDMQNLIEQYKKCVANYSIDKVMSNFKLIRHLKTKVIGCTTTGLSKYRALLESLNCRILLVEEAAETLEGTIMAGLLNSLQQLILVGDHKQLQASCNVPALEQAPYYMNVSLFERLINNNQPFVMLNTQRRMIPEVRKLLCVKPDPFYHGLKDHSYVLDRVNNRPPVSGMGGRNVLFHHRDWPESINADHSRYNETEAQMIAGFFHYLILNGMDASKITVLTFYNGQRKAILRHLKGHYGLHHVTYFNVVTVDGYQGEENDIIILSLVRSNARHQVGFLENRNRAVVALSRARRGLYIFGNAITMAANESFDELYYGRDALWGPIIAYMRQAGQLVRDCGFPIVCANHQNELEIVEPEDWDNYTGGCELPCEESLPCGHPCQKTCHPFDHTLINCKMACSEKLPCGHGCSMYCSEPCRCDRCQLDANVSHWIEEVEVPEPSVLSKPILFVPESSRLVGKDTSTPVVVPESSTSDRKVKSTPQTPSISIRRSPERVSTVSDWKTWNAEKADNELAATNQVELSDPESISGIRERFVKIQLESKGGKVTRQSPERQAKSPNSTVDSPAKLSKGPMITNNESLIDLELDSAAEKAKVLIPTRKILSNSYDITNDESAAPLSTQDTKADAGLKDEDLIQF